MRLTLSQFFAEGDMLELTPELRKLFEHWRALNPAQRSAVRGMMQAFTESK